MTCTSLLLKWSNTVTQYQLSYRIKGGMVFQPSDLMYICMSAWIANNFVPSKEDVMDEKQPMTNTLNTITIAGLANNNGNDVAVQHI